MTIVRNRTVRPIRVPLPGGHVLHLGPGKSAEVTDRAIEGPTVRRLLEDGTLALDAEPGPPHAREATLTGAHVATHGHAPRTAGLVKGDR